MPRNHHSNSLPLAEGKTAVSRDGQDPLFPERLAVTIDKVDGSPKYAAEKNEVKARLKRVVE